MTEPSGSADAAAAAALQEAAAALQALADDVTAGRYDLDTPSVSALPGAGARLAAAHNRNMRRGGGYITAAHGTAEDPQFHPDWASMEAAHPRLHYDRIIYGVQQQRLSVPDAQEHVERVARAWTGRAAVKAQIAQRRAEALDAAARAVFTAAVDGGIEFAGWLAAALGAVASTYPGKAAAVLAERPGSWEAEHVRGLITGTIGTD